MYRSSPREIADVLTDFVVVAIEKPQIMFRQAKSKILYTE